MTDATHATSSSATTFTDRAWLPAVFLLALLLRLHRAQQSLWGDEMESLLHFVVGPWRVVLAAGPGQYVPNDHVFYTALAKLCLTVGANGQVDPARTAAMLIRLPSVVAGALIPVALAWPLRRRAPLAAAMLAIAAAAHPWLVAQAGEARGYAVMALLGVVATSLLPGRDRRWPVGYAIAVALAIYTVPVALLLVAGHGLVALARRGTRANWLRGVAMAAVLTGLLYLPLASGVADYYRHPLAGPDDNADFANQLPRFAAAGRYLPANDDPAVHIPSPWGGLGYWLVPVALLVGGTRLARRNPHLWPITVAMMSATAIAALLPLALPAAGQVRFVPWAGLWLCAAVVALLLWAGDRFGRTALVAGSAAALGWLIWATLTMPPDQPVREAIAEADRLAPPGRTVVVAFFTADEAVRLYRGAAEHHDLLAAATPPAAADAEARSLRATGHRPWLVVSFEFLLHDLRPDVWRSLTTHFRLVERLPGRTTPVAIYEPAD